jgi:RNA polymerase sigma-32 factor
MCGIMGFINILWRNKIKKLTKHEAKKMSILSYEDERMLLAQAKDGNIDSRNRLVEHHLRMIYVTANELQMKGFYYMFDDLVQEGTISFIKCIENFDMSHESRLSTYARYYVYSAMSEYVTSNVDTIRLYRTKPQLKIANHINKYLNERGNISAKSVAEICEKFNVTEEDVYTVAMKKNGVVTSMEESFNEENGGNGADTPDYSMSPEKVMENRLYEYLCLVAIPEAVSQLEERTRLLFEECILSDNPETLLSFGKRHGISAERARQVKEQGYKQMKPFLAQYM